MAFPSIPATKVFLDQSTDSPASARAELATLVDKVNEIIASYAQIDGVCDLDAAGLVPTARIPSVGNIDADTIDGIEGVDIVQVTRTITAGSGLTGGGTLAADRTLSHSDTSSASSVNNSDPNVIQDITVDTYGHVTAIVSRSVATISAGLGVYAVGSYMFAVNTSATTEVPGGTCLGSVLDPTGIQADGTASVEGVGYACIYNATPAGTWRCMGYATTYGTDPVTHSVTLWLRIS